MGLNTPILVRNDCLGDIQKNAQEFADGVVAASLHGGYIRCGSSANAADVMQAAHVDIFRLFTVHGNCMIEMDQSTELVDQYTKSESFRKVIDKRIRWGNSALRMLRRKLNEIAPKKPPSNKKPRKNDWPLR